MKTSAGAGGEVVKGGQHLFWHVALRASHVLGESCVSICRGSSEFVGQGSPATERPPVVPVCVWANHAPCQAS